MIYYITCDYWHKTINNLDNLNYSILDDIWWTYSRLNDDILRWDLDKFIWYRFE